MAGETLELTCEACGKTTKVTVERILAKESPVCRHCDTPYDPKDIGKIQAQLRRLQKATAKFTQGIAKTARNMKAR